ncbi:MAG: ribulose-phosphate 3-epimerase [Flavobacteriia bacterium]|nr:ribulose-phosphate 3-epimerase [Flavobacteriia bacterium]
MNRMIVAPSLLSCDFSNLKKDLDMINESAAEWIHFDVMDGVFVPNISFGFPILQATRKCTDKTIDVHLMIQNPDLYVERFHELGANNLTVHLEACTHLHRTVHKIKELGMRAGVAINPHTPVHALDGILSEVDIVLVMSVNPGFGGQSFLPNSIAKVQELRNKAEQSNPSLIIEVDGGVNNLNAELLAEAGAHALVAGNFVFSSPDPKRTIEQLSQIDLR